MRTTNQTKVLALLALSLSACEVPSQMAPVASTQPAAETPTITATSTQTSTDTSISPSLASFCIPHELRTDYSIAMPSISNSAFKQAITNGPSNRIADPKCDIANATTVNGVTYLACAVTLQSANVNQYSAQYSLYGSAWTTWDQHWIQDALTHEMALDGIPTNAIMMTVGNINNASYPMLTQVPLVNSPAALVLSIDTTQVNFTGYCQ